MNPFSTLWTTKLSDWQRGLIVAVLSVPFTVLYDTLTTTPIVLTFDWKKILGASIAAGIAYIFKNFMTGKEGNLLTNSSKSLLISNKTNTPK